MWCPHYVLRKKIPQLCHLQCIQSWTKVVGRAGGMLLATKNSDLLVWPVGAKAETRYRRTTQELIDWSGVISEAFYRTLPIVWLDPNDGLGLCQGQRERSMALGEGCKAKDGRADRLFRLMLAEQKSSRNTHTRNRYTEPGSAPNTRPRRRTGQRRLRAKSG